MMVYQIWEVESRGCKAFWEVQPLCDHPENTGLHFLDNHLCDWVHSHDKVEGEHQVMFVNPQLILTLDLHLV